jgi:hypothetical protein
VSNNEIDDQNGRRPPFLQTSDSMKFTVTGPRLPVLSLSIEAIGLSAEQPDFKVGKVSAIHPAGSKGKIGTVHLGRHNKPAKNGKTLHDLTMF